MEGSCTSSGDIFFVTNYDNKDIPVKVNGIINIIVMKLTRHKV